MKLLYKSFLVVFLLLSISGCTDKEKKDDKVAIKHQLTPNEKAAKNLLIALSVGIGKDGETYSIDATRALSSLNKTDFTNVTDEDIVFLYKYYKRVFEDIKRKDTSRKDDMLSTLTKESIDLFHIMVDEGFSETIDRYKNIFHDITGETEERTIKIKQKYLKVLKFI
jgi:predicted small lipoprotein YifL